jgi:outer membrane protein
VFEKKGPVQPCKKEHAMVALIKQGTLILLAIACAGWSSDLAAQTATTLKIGIVAMSRAISDCGEGKQAIEEFQKKLDARKKELDQKATEVEQLQTQLNRQSATLNDEAKRALAKVIETKSTALQRAKEDSEKEFGQLQSEILSKVGSKMYRLVQEFAKEQKFLYVIDSTNQSAEAFVYMDGVDITSEVVKKYDATYPASAVPSTK